MAHDKRRTGRITEELFSSIIREFQRSPKWVTPPPEGYSENTKRAFARELEFMERPNCLGRVSIHEIKPSIVQAYFDGIAHLPGKQAMALAVLRVLEKWAMVRDKLPRQITLGVEINHSEGGHLPWSDEQVSLGERYGGRFARAITLAANTGQRGSDLVRMGPNSIEVFRGIRGIVVTQKKTRKQIWIPITSELDAAMATWERRPGPFLVHDDGRPWSRESLSNLWRIHRDRTPELAPLRIENLERDPTWPTKDKGLVFHGLRGTACVRLRRAGATESQISDMVGMSIEMVARYCRFSIQRENAAAAVFYLERTIRERVQETAFKKP